MTKVYFCFDTEDFTSNHAADAIRDEARILEEYGIRGNFNLVGYLARELVRNGRQDVLDALKSHIISDHSLRHSYHPTINEYTDIEDYDLARERFHRYEDEGAGMIKSVFGVDSFPAACPPGNSISYVAIYGYAERGIPLYLGSCFETTDGTGVFMCNAFHTNYDCCMESLFVEDPEELSHLLDRISKLKRVVMYNHPNKVLYSEFWDMVNYNGANLYEMYQWKEPTRRTPEATALYYRRFREFIEAVIADPRFEVSNIEELKAETDAMTQNRTVSRDMLPAIRDQLRKDFSWLNEPALSLADCFYAAKHFLTSDEPYVPGTVHGFLDDPVGVTEPVSLEKAQILKMAEQADPRNFFPTFFEADGVRIGPRDLLFAMLDTAIGADTVRVEPGEQRCDISRLPGFQAFAYNAWINGPFNDQLLLKRLKLQDWTIRQES